MAISTRRIGAIVPCPYCAAEIMVPAADALDLPSVSPADSPQLEPQPREPIVDDAAAIDDAPSEIESPATAPLFASPPPAFQTEDLRQCGAEYASDESDEETDDGDDAVWLPPRAPRFEEDELDMTAMVDVVFQLLIFFMVTASFSLQKSIEVPTPDQPKQGLAQALKPLEELQDVAILVAVDDRNGVTVDDDPLSDLSDLADVLSDRMRRDQKSELILTSSRNAAHRVVIAVIDAANQVGMQRIRLASAPPSSE